jgi:Hypothetical glycosyl hydrolase family 15
MLVEDHAVSDPVWRPKRPRRWLPLLALVVVLAVTAGAVAVALRHRAAPSKEAGQLRPTVRTWSGDLDSKASDAHLLQESRASVVVINAWELDRLRRLKAESPGTKVLVYKDMASVRSYPGALNNGKDAPLLPTGVGYAVATAHPDWFLTDAAGKRLEWQDYPGHWHVDVGNPEYQQLWLENVSREVQANGWDGVMIDNALTRAEQYNPGRPPQRYPNDRVMQQATRSMLAAVGPTLQRHGFSAFANIGDSRLTPGLWEDWGSLLTGPSEENFVTYRSGNGYYKLLDDGADGWRRQVDDLAATEQAHRSALVNSKGPAEDVPALLYGLSSFLLASEGHGSFSYEPGGRYAQYEYNLGGARGPYKRLKQGVYSRQFERGLVLVNPSGSSVDVALPKPYRDDSDQVVHTVRLPSASGLILRST